jgi:small subunit ribosomal protein S5e
MDTVVEEQVAQNGIKLFNKWTFDGIEVKDMALTDYIQVRNPVYLPHTAGRYQVKRFRKAQVSFPKHD